MGLKQRSIVVRKVSCRRELVRHFCDRHRGIGADGVIRVCNAEHPQADFRMKLYNADGSQARMCGNGIRVWANMCMIMEKQKK